MNRLIRIGRSTGSAHPRQGAGPLHAVPMSSRFVEKAERRGSKGRRPFAGTGRARVLALLAALLFTAVSGPAQADEATEGRLRDALRQAIAQQRTLEDSQTQLQAKVSDQDKQIQALQAQLAAKPQAQPEQKAQLDQAAIERIAAEANRRITAQNEAITRTNEALEKWKAAYEQAANVARTKEAERARLAAQMDGAGKRIEACEAKNAALFKAANEVLDHLKDISVAEAMEAHEPFVGTKRVELQNLAQDDEDKLLDQKVETSPDAPKQAAAGGNP